MTTESFEDAVRKAARLKREPSPFIRKGIETLKPPPKPVVEKPKADPIITQSSILARLVVNMEQVKFEVEELKLRCGSNVELERKALEMLVAALEEGPAWIQHGA